MHGIEAKQMGIGLDRTQIIDGNHFDVVALSFKDSAQDIAANSPKPVDCDSQGHSTPEEFTNSAIWRHIQNAAATRMSRPALAFLIQLKRERRVDLASHADCFPTSSYANPN
jgi:hypothetical protein